MDPQVMRLECLRLAHTMGGGHSTPGKTIALARRLYDFLVGKEDAEVLQFNLPEGKKTRPI